MAVDTEAQVRRLTEAYRAQQSRRAAQVAALVAAYYSTRVQIDDPTSIQRWLDLMVPRLLKEHDAIARLAAAYSNTLRRIELDRLTDDFTFTPARGANLEQIERSLRVVGPEAHLRKMTEIRRLDVSPAMKTVLTSDARKAAVTKIGGAAARHVQNGGRQTLFDGAQADPEAIGYIRVTKTDPCFFCAALASRGIVYGEDSFDASDARFTGDGRAKVHDSCACSVKPVYTPQDALLRDTANFEALWFQSDGTLLGFRRMYEGRTK